MSDPTDSEGGSGPAEQFWEQHYRGRHGAWSGRANAVLVDIAGPLPTGTALDLGCAEGGDAIWLAARGWQVTGVDVSATALERASRHARDAGVADRVTFQRHDLTRTFPDGRFDLVTAQYLQSPVAFPRAAVLQAASRAVASGGLLLVVDHASVAPWSWADPDTRFPTPQEALAVLELDLGRWQVEQVGAPQRQATGPSGETAIVTDNVIAIRRRTE